MSPRIHIRLLIGLDEERELIGGWTVKRLPEGAELSLVRALDL